MTEVRTGTCSKCGKSGMTLIPLHGEKCGPVWCMVCVVDWNVEHGRRRRAGRVVLKAMRLFLQAGGTGQMLGKLKDAAILTGWGVAPPSGYEPDTIGAEIGDITSELLSDVLQLTHPDRHPSERRELAQRVTADLLALRPFVFPAPKPAKPASSSGSAGRQPDPFDEALRKQDAYPCALCAGEIPMHYCSTCRGRWEEDQRKEKEQEARKRAEKATKQRERRSTIKKYYTPRVTRECPECHEKFEPKRADAVYCSAACRQAAHRKRDGQVSPQAYINSADVERAIEAAFLADPDNAYTTDDLCDRAFPGLNCVERKHRAVIPPAAKAVCQRLDERWDCWRGEARGGTMVFWNRTSVMSYAMARQKALSLGTYRPKPGTWGWYNRKTEDDLRAEIAPGGRYHKYVVEGGAWWEHCQEDIARFKNVTAQQAVAGADLTNRNAAEAS